MDPKDDYLSQQRVSASLTYTSWEEHTTNRSPLSTSLPPSSSSFKINTNDEMLNPVSWEKLNETRKAIKVFLKSLNNIGDNNLACFDEGSFTLQRRRTHHLLLPVTWTSATFEKTQKGFIQLRKQIDLLDEKIASFSPTKKEDCLPGPLQFLHKLFSLRSVTAGARVNTELLCKAYANRRKEAKGQSVQKLGVDSFEKLDEATGILLNRLSMYIHELRKDSELIDYGLDAWRYLVKRGIYCQQLREVGWEKKEGAVIPYQLLHACDKEEKCVRKYSLSNDALKNAASMLKLSLEAKEVHVQDKSIYWTPLRVMRQNDQIIVEKEGVTGTYERVESEQADVCNVYVRLDSEYQRPMISTGAINTSHKALELAQVIQNINNGLSSFNNKRWIVHQLNSFNGEGKVIDATHVQVAEMEASLRKTIPEISILHINTAFNLATKLDFEDPQSLNINIDSLAQLVEYARQDINSLNKASSLNKWDVESKIVEESGLQYGEEEEIEIETLSGKEEDGGIEEIYSKEEEENEVKNKEWQAFEKTCQIVFDLAKEIKNLENLINQHQEGETSKGAERITTYPEDLFVKRSDLKTNLESLVSCMTQCIEDWQKQQKEKGSDVYLGKAILVLNVLKQIFTSQLRLEKSSLSRCSEIELFLLLYRLLDIKVIITCWSGLDRTGYAVAMDDALSQLEKEIIAFNQKQLEGRLNNNSVQMHPDLAHQTIQLKSFNMLFDLIININANRRKLFELGNSLLVENSSLSPIKDLNILEKPIKDSEVLAKRKENSANFRESFLNKITGQSGEGSSVEESISSHQLNIEECTLFYLELIAYHLLGPQQEKAFFSTGVFGLKYRYSDSWIGNKLIANPHLLERLPQFIFTDEGQIIQLMEYTPAGWLMSESFNMTPVASATICRSSHLRE